MAIAYRLLADEGWLDLKGRRGAVVIARNAPRSMDRNRVDQLLQQLAHIALEPTALVNEAHLPLVNLKQMQWQNGGPGGLAV